MKKIRLTARSLNRDEQKNIRGGIAWPELRRFTCKKPNGTVVGYGCTEISGIGHSCCYSLGGTSVVWGAYGCPYEHCN